MIIYQISLAKNVNAEEFISFMQEEYFPAIHKGPTRIGQVSELTLLSQDRKETDADAGPEFLWHVGWGGLSMEGVRVNDENVVRKFEAFKPKIKLLGFYREVATWRPSPGAE